METEEAACQSRQWHKLMILNLAVVRKVVTESPERIPKTLRGLPVGNFRESALPGLAEPPKGGARPVPGRKYLPKEKTLLSILENSSQQCLTLLVLSIICRRLSTMA